MSRMSARDKSSTVFQ